MLEHSLNDRMAYNGCRKEATMSLHCMCVCVALALPTISDGTPGSFGPAEAAAYAVFQRAREPAAGNVDFKIAVWYSKADLASFKYEIYDVRKGQYTPKVDEWVKHLQAKYPGYFVAVRDVDLKREEGDTEQLKVGSVIRRELIAAAGTVGIVIDSRRGASLRPFVGLGAGRSAARPAFDRWTGSTSRDRGYLTPGATMFPVPVPIPNRPR
jgi:hypothetical protein